jgi:peptidoglycan-associated lipoprotein
MRAISFLTPLAVMALAAGCHYGPSAGTATPQQGGDIALRLHLGGLHPATELVSAEAPQPDTVEVAIGPNQDSLDAANRARADSLEQVRQAAERSARASGDSAARMSAALREDLAGMIHFDFDRAQIQPDDRAALDRKATILAANPAVRLRIAGGCDERGSVAYNVALGSRRAAAAKQYLIERGIDAGRLEEVSSGEGSPIDPGQNEAAWVQNRRAEFEVVSGGDALTAPVALR